MSKSYTSQIRVSNLRNETIKHEAFLFSGGEMQVALEQVSYDPMEALNRHSSNIQLDVTANIRDANGVMELMMLVDALRRQYAKSELHLTLPYLPYARQDRVMKPGEALSLKVFCTLINSLNFTTVNVWDVHSDVSLALLDRAYNTPQEDFLLLTGLFTPWEVGADGEEQAIENLPILVAPDAGAMKKISAAAKAMGTTYIRADKTRDVKTGAITGTVVYPPGIGHFDEDANYLIVDDICDGGRTFIELGRELRKITAGKVMLYVTHGIFSAGLGVLTEIFDHIYVANSFLNVGMWTDLTLIDTNQL